MQGRVNLTLTDEDVRELVGQWHEDNGGHARRGTKYHALRILHEVVELCINDGASVDELIEVIRDESNKALSRGQLGKVGNSAGEEVADVGILLDIYCHHADINPTFEKVKKHRVNLDRRWKVDVNGVLWRKV